MGLNGGSAGAKDRDMHELVAHRMSGTQLSCNRRTFVLIVSRARHGVSCRHEKRRREKRLLAFARGAAHGGKQSTRRIRDRFFTARYHLAIVRIHKAIAARRVSRQLPHRARGTGGRGIRKSALAVRLLIAEQIVKSSRLEKCENIMRHNS